jgi:tetratricopeptide (TPR) repeat protein
MELASWKFYFESAEFAEEGGNYEQACKMYQRAIEKASKANVSKKIINRLHLEMYQVSTELNDHELVERIYEQWKAYAQSKKINTSYIYSVYCVYLQTHGLLEKEAEVAKELYQFVCNSSGKGREVELLNVSSSYADVLHQLGRVDEALEILDHIDYPDPFVLDEEDTGAVMGSYRLLGDLCIETGDFNKADLYFEKAKEVAYLLRIDDPYEYLSAIQYQALALLKMGRKQEAVEMVDGMLQWSKEWNGESDFSYAYTLVDASDVYREVEEFELARQSLEKACRIYRQEVSSDSAEIKGLQMKVAELNEKISEKNRG